jgi:hypothetical protein
MPESLKEDGTVREIRAVSVKQTSVKAISVKDIVVICIKHSRHVEVSKIFKVTLCFIGVT